MLQHAATQCFGIAAYCQDTSRFGGLCRCPLLRRALPVSSRGEQTAVATRSGSARRWRPGLRLTASTGGHGRPSEAGSASASTTCLKQGSACRKVVVMFVIMALKNLRRRDLRPKGPDHNHGELAPRITRLAWARESKASHRVSALSGEPGPPKARSDPGLPSCTSNPGASFSRPIG